MITIPTGDLVGVLSDVSPFALAAPELPHLNCVRLEWDGQMLHALATDRYRMGISSWQPGDDPGDDVQEDLFTEWGGSDPPWAIDVALDEALELVKVFKLPRKQRQTALVLVHELVDEEKARLTVRRNQDTGKTEVSVAVEWRTRRDYGAARFPDVRGVLAEHDRLKPVKDLVFTAKLLADFALVRPRGLMEMRFTGINSPVRVTIGDRFEGAIMPVRQETPKGKGIDLRTASGYLVAAEDPD